MHLISNNWLVYIYIYIYYLVGWLVGWLYFTKKAKKLLITTAGRTNSTKTKKQKEVNNCMEISF